MNYKYCNDILSYSRFLTREINIGGVPLGGENPIRIQSMTNTNTLDTEATVGQCIRIIKAGADYVRITAQGIREAENLLNIKAELRNKGFKTPLIADVHFNPKVAEIAAAIVEKIRINPGNYINKNSSGKIEFSDSEYNNEIEKIHTNILPLLKICRVHGTAIRIGVNHGSLSNRIICRYGNTPRGMVESAMEFLRICAGENFHNIVVSLKASNTRDMVYSNRLLVNSMLAEGLIYPLHLGVTEAGEGEDGIVKSSLGIGALLADGIGDTIRVSLTGEPEEEIPVAKELIKYFTDREKTFETQSIKVESKNPFEYKKRDTCPVENIGGKNLAIIITDWVGGNESPEMPEYFYLNKGNNFDNLPDKFNYILNLHDWFKYVKHKKNIFPLYTVAEFNTYGTKHSNLNFVIVSNEDYVDCFSGKIKNSKNAVLIFETINKNSVADQRSFFYKLIEQGINVPVILNKNYSEDSLMSFQIKAASDLGAMLIDGFSDGIWIRNNKITERRDIISLPFNILQAGRVRMSKTDYISCPSCGRSLFDIKSEVLRIKQKTSQLKHLKIAIMGCIVNGPGEMADADYGFVGSGPEKISLYKGKQVVKKDIISKNALEELIELIKSNGDWVDP